MPGAHARRNPRSLPNFPHFWDFSWREQRCALPDFLPPDYSARMVGRSAGAVRQPAVAGLFYPAADEPCRTLASRLVTANSAVAGDQTKWIGGIVPHAGWVCSGAIAGEVIGTIAARNKSPD